MSLAAASTTRPNATNQQLMLRDNSSFRLDNGETIGPRRSRWSATSMTTRAVQGMVTVNVAVRKDLYSTRHANSERLSDSERLGTAASVDDTDIHPHELMFTYKRPAVRRGGGSSGILGFTSFNGVPIINYEGSQDAFESNWRLLGRAKIPYDFDSDEQSNSGVSVQVRGACSISNRGTSEFFPHDKIRWRLPSLDKETRQHYAQQMHVIEGSPKRKELPILEPVTYADLYKMPQRALAAYRKTAALAGGASKIATRNVGPMATDRPDDLTRFAIGYMRAAGLMKAYAAIAVLVEHKLITLAPELAAASGNSVAFKALVDKQVLSARPSEQVTQQQAAGLTTLAYLLDLAIPKARDEYIKPAESVIADIILAQNRGLADDADHLRLSRFVGAADAPAQRESFESKIDLMQVNAVRRETELFATIKNAEDEKIVGLALSHSFPGEIVDVLF